MPHPALPRRRPALLALVTGVAVGLLAAGASLVVHHTSVANARPPATAVRQVQPNIVMVMADDMRADDMRFMPAVRRLIADRGLTYRNSFSPYPLCCPARASWLTGQYAHNHGVLSNRRPFGFAGFDDRRTLATSLRSAGYQTAYVGKYLNSYGRVRSRLTGRPSWRYVPPGWTDWYGAVERPRRVYKQFPRGGAYNYFHTIFNVNGRIDDSHRGQYQTNVLGRFTRALVTRYSRSSKPFFVYVSALAPHHGNPTEPDDVNRVRYSGGRSDFRTPARPDWVKGRFDTRVRRGAGLPRDGGPSELDMSDKPRTMRNPPHNKRERRAERMLTRQRAEALYVLDSEVAKVVRRLKHTGEYANTVIMFTSDNGFFLGEHGQRSGKHRPHEPSLRVPFLIAGPGIPRGVRHDPVRTFDLTATVTDLARAEPPRRPDGVSLVPSFSGDLGWTYPVLTEARIPGDLKRDSGQLLSGRRTSIGLRTARYKLIKYASGEVELYDLVADPNELDSVARDPDYDALLQELTRLWRSYKDCGGDGCNVPLPPELQQSPGQLAATTKTQSSGVLARYGHTF